MVTAYATAQDVEDRWRPLSAAEVAQADVLAMDASFRVRRRFPTLDARLEAGDIDPLEVAGVVAGMVKRAMIVGEGVTQRTEVAGPYQSSQTYANPMGNLYLSADDLSALEDPAAAATGRRAFSVDLTPVYEV